VFHALQESVATPRGRDCSPPRAPPHPDHARSLGVPLELPGERGVGDTVPTAKNQLRISRLSQLQRGYYMKEIRTISFCLVLLAVLSGHAWAGSYKCVLATGTIDQGGSLTLPVIFHFNTGSATQSITRTQVFDSGGNLIYDTGPIPVGAIVAPPRGS